MLSDISMNEKIIKFNSEIQSIQIDQYLNEIWIKETDNNYYSIIQLNDLKVKKLEIRGLEKFNLFEVNNGLAAFKKVHDPSKIYEAGFKIYSIWNKEFIKEKEGFRFINFNSYNTYEFSRQQFESIEYFSENLDVPELSNQLSNQKTITKPDIIHKGQDFYLNVIKHFASLLKGEIIGAIEYAESSNLIFFSFHTRQNETLDKYLLALNEKKEIAFKKLCNQKIDKLIPETFFLYGKFLIFVSSFNTLHIINFTE